MKDFTRPQAAKLCAAIQSRGAADRVLVASMGHSALSAFRTNCPAVATSVSLPEGLILYALYRLHVSSLYRGPAAAIQGPRNLGRTSVVQPGLLWLTQDFNLKFQVWTVNEPAEMKRLIALGVHGIMTDYPDRLLETLGRK
jgi:glycerophosphoryl diester phosphodiesterase